MSLDHRWEDVDKLLKTTGRTKDEKHAKTVHSIAEERFKFPTQEHASYRTYINVPQVTMGVMVGDEELTPDIVVVERLNTGETHVIMTAEVVALPEEANEVVARQAWSRFASVADAAFYLYVPVGYGAQAKKLCRRLKMDVTGFRTWRNTPRGFEINDISEQPSPLAALMPPVVRKILAPP